MPDSIPHSTFRIPHFRAGALRRHAWLAPALLAVILMRALLLHNDPTDFPIDRNINTAGKLNWLTEVVAQKPFGLEFIRKAAWASKETPEFPFLPLGAWGLTQFGLPPIAAARLFSLLSAVALALGLYGLGRRLGPPLVGIVAVWVYALNPLAVHMGRGLLPDQVMMTALVLALAAAWRPGARPSWTGACAMTFWLVLAVLAKLPALFFVPVVAAAWMQAAHWRRWSSWIAVLSAILITYLTACRWYHLDFFSPLAGLKRLSENTNHALLAAPWTLLGPSLTAVTIDRMVLALTLPGLVLGLLGWLLVQARPGQRLWLNLWVVFALVFLIVTLDANSYWVYSLTPVGCLLAGVGVAELVRRGRWTLLPLGLALLLGWRLDPAVGLVSRYLCIHPEYRAIKAAAKRLDLGDSVLYAGAAGGDIAYFVRRPGYEHPTLDAALLDRTRAGTFSEVISNHMWGDDVIGDLFFYKPILETRPGLYVIYRSGPQARLGEPVAADALTSTAALDLNLSGTLRIRSIKARPARVAPGDKMDLELIFEKGAAYQPAPCLALDFQLEPSGLILPVQPFSGGVSFGTWTRPVFIQTPDFGTSLTLARMRYGFEIPSNIPAGTYGLRFNMTKGVRLTAPLGPPVKAPHVLEVLPPVGSARLPLRIDPADCLWQAPLFQNALPWLGRPRRVVTFQADSQIWIRPNLPPGIYELRLTGRALPVRVALGDVWPVLRLKKTELGTPLQFRFTSEGRESVRGLFRWRGPQDYLNLALDNPAFTPVPNGAFQLSLTGEMSGGRGVVLEGIEVRPAPEGRTPEQEEENAGS